MKLIFVLLTVVFFAMAIALSADLEEWNAYKLKYGKNYQNQTEEKFRMEIFLNNKHKIEEHNEKHNKGLVSYKMSVHKFSDLLAEEFNAQMKGIRPPSLLASTHIQNDTIDEMLGSRHHRHRHHHHHHRHQKHQSISTHLPDSIDWRDEGAVNSIADKLQGSCGSCWAFTTTGAIEGQYFRKTGKLIRLSEQNLVDCVLDCGCNGCSLSEAFYHAQDHGIDTFDKYPKPYSQEDGFCQFDSSNPIKTKGHKFLPEGDENSLCEAIATIGPISVEINANHDSLMHYSSGIYYEPECSSHSLDHGVLAVGYGTTEDGKDYYILKNWWKDWGENGYLRLARNRDNHCGVATNAVYPIL